MQANDPPPVSEALAALLEHLDPLTGERQRPQLECLMVEALARIAGARRVAFSKLLQTPDETLCWLAVETADGHTHVVDDGINAPPGLTSLETLPDIVKALVADSPLHIPLSDGVRLVMPVDGPGSASGFLEVEMATAPDRKCMMLMTTAVTVFRNIMGLLDYSEVDTLTGLLNRKTFDEHLMKIVGSLSHDDDSQVDALHLPRRRHAPSSAGTHWLAVLDIDHFKRINDNFGHLIGDEVLLLVATLMKNSFRFRDKLFRFGGEEFVVVLKPTTADQAKAIFERFRQAIEAYPFPQVGVVTLSIGFAPIRAQDQPSMILDHADRALYWAKEHGRNLVAAFEELVADGRLERPTAAASEIELF